MNQSPNKANLDTSLQAVLQGFYNKVIVPSAETDELDPVELFAATVKGALELQFEDKLDEQRSAFFTLRGL